MQKRSILVLTVILLGTLAGGLAYDYYRSNHSQPTINSPDGVNYNPPTDSEKAESESRKDATGQSTSNKPVSSDGKLRVDVAIASTWQSDGNFNVTGFVSNVAENGGTCNLIVTKGTQSVKSSRQAVANATTTNCGLMSIPRSSLSSGTWDISLQYSSPKYSGVSETMKVDL